MRCLVHGWGRGCIRVKGKGTMGVENRTFLHIAIVGFGADDPLIRFLWKYVGGRLQVFKWTGRNEYVALCEPEYLSFGGGYVFIADFAGS